MRISRREREFGDGASRGDTPDLIFGQTPIGCHFFRKPDIVIWPHCNMRRHTARWQPVRTDFACRSNTTNLSVGAGAVNHFRPYDRFGEPEIAIRPGSDATQVAMKRIWREFADLA